MRLWHDDIRRPPDDTWTWARTNDEAKRLLATGEVEECSLDHDLGLDSWDADEPGAVFQRGGGAQTGYHLALWMAETGHVPPVVTIHSWNPEGAKRMALALAKHAGADITIRPYEVPHGQG